jgi:hypothetical protein
MKRCLAFALIAAIGMFIVGCGEPKPPAGMPKPDPTKGFGTGKTNKAPANPGAPAKRP